MRRTFRKAAALVLALAQLMCLSVTALAADGEGLPLIRDYGDAGFTDVANDWSLEGIQGAYELGLMEGVAARRFDPNGTATLAQIVTVAVRMRDLWTGGTGEISTAGVPWYGAAVEYALEHGIITQGQFADYTVAATRAEVAGILAKALPGDAYAALNQINGLPDVKASSAYYGEIMTLYRAGVLTGNDDYGTFQPNSNISRKELAAILCRLARPGTRKVFSLKTKPMDTKVYGTNRLLVLNGIAMPGVLEINGEPFFPARDFNSVQDGGASAGVTFETAYKTNYDQQTGYYVQDRNTVEGYEMYIGKGFESPGTVVDTARVQSVRWQVGQAVSANMPLTVYKWVPADEATDAETVEDPYDELWRLWLEMNGFDWAYEPPQAEEKQVKETLNDAVYLLDGEYPLIRLSALGIADTGGDIVWNTGEMTGTLSKEKDLAGEAVKGLIRGTARETVTAIHDYIVNTITYDPRVEDELNSRSHVTEAEKSAADQADAAAAGYKTGNNFTLASGYGVCADYSDLFRYMCLCAGIPCLKISGYGEGASHAWNKVFLDGKWQYVDCTFDDPVSASRKPMLLHDYLLVDAAAMAKDHLWEGDDSPMPRKYDPAWETIDPNNIRTPDDYRKCLAAQVYQRKTEFTLTVSSSDAFGGHTGLLACFFWYGVSLRSYRVETHGRQYTYTITYR